MTWADVTTIYQLSTLAMMLMCAIAYALERRALDLFAAGAVVFIFTVMSSFIVSAYDPPWSSAHMPVQDLICASVAWWSWQQTPSHRWSRWLAVAFTVQCGVHAAYWGLIGMSYMFASGESVGQLSRIYPWPINGLFVIELLILIGAGGGYVADHVRTRLLVLRHLPSAHRPHGGGR